MLATAGKFSTLSPWRCFSSNICFVCLFFFVYLFHLFCLFSTINKQTWTQLKSFRLVSNFFYGQYPEKRNPEVLYKFCPFGIIAHSEFCPILNFVHSEFCTILEFLLRDLFCGILSVNGFGFLMNFFFF